MNTGAGIHRPVVRVGAQRRDPSVTDVTYTPLRPGRKPRGGAVEGDFAAYARDRWPRLVATARLLTEDPGAAEELARRTLVRVCARWRRIPRNDVDFHVWRCLVRGYLRGHRTGGRRRVVPVLRYWEGLGEAEIAQVLGCSVGAVRAVVRRGKKEARPEDRRAGFAAVLAGLVPSAVPLDDIQRDGALRRRRRAGVVAAGCALLLAPPAVLAVGSLTGGEVTGAAEEPDRPEPGPMRIVAPGERVSAAPGVDVWLTPDGHHWSSPQASNQFRAVGDGNLDRAREGVSVQGEQLDDGRYFQTGVYHGLTAEPARIEIRTGGRTVTANVLTLAGSPGWGVWYATTPLTDSLTDRAKAVAEAVAEAASPTGDGPTGDGPTGDGPAVTVYDAAGDVMVRSDLGPSVARPVPVGAWRS